MIVTGPLPGHNPRVYQFSGASLEGPREGKDERGGVLLGGRPFGFLSVNHRKS